MSSEEKTTGRRTLTGEVVSAKMDKTVTVAVSRMLKHPRYHKYIRRTKNYKAHDEDNVCLEGDTVVIEECRPLSKTKRFRVIEREASVQIPERKPEPIE